MLLIAIVALIGGLTFRSYRMATAAVATIAVGIGLDYLIYIAFHIREQLAKGLPFRHAAARGHMSAGGAAACVAMAVAVGYIVLLFSPSYLLHHWIAVPVPLTMLSSPLGALFVFPFLLRVLRPPLLQNPHPAVTAEMVLSDSN